MQNAGIRLMNNGLDGKKKKRPDKKVHKGKQPAIQTPE